MAEALVLNLVKGNNKPYNVQGVADMLATKGVKKTAAEKALDSLAEQGKLVRKEFGKQKLYIPNQEGLPVLSPEQETEMKAANKQLQDDLRAEEEALAALRKELAASSSQLTLDEIKQQIEQVGREAEQLEAKLAPMRSGARLISTADVTKVEKVFRTLFDAWARHRRQFRSVWDTVSEGLEGKEEALFDEIGVESDKAVGADFEGMRTLAQTIKVQAPAPAKKLKR